MATQARPKTAAELLGVPVVAERGRERLVDVAVELFYKYGFNAVGLDQVLAEAGVTKTTFYKHFDSKDALMVAAVQKRDQWETQAWRRAVGRMGGDDPRAQLLAFFDVLDIWFNDPDFKGCLFINTAAEFPNPHDPVHQAAAAHKRRARDEIRDLARKAGARDADAFADQYAMLIEGTLVLRQVHGRDDAARVARGMAERLIEEHMPG
jgi:AcrR family transcriptional regulator